MTICRWYALQPDAVFEKENQEINPTSKLELIAMPYPDSGLENAFFTLTKVFSPSRSSNLLQHVNSEGKSAEQNLFGKHRKYYRSSGKFW